MEGSPQKSKFRRKATGDEDEKVVFEGDPNDCEELKEIQMKDLKEAPTKFEDIKSEVTDPLEEINFGSLEELKVTYVCSLLTGRAERKGSPYIKRVQILLCLEL